MQVPTPTNETVPELIVHTAFVAVVISTVNPELELAKGVYPDPPKVAVSGAVDKNEMVCNCNPTPKLCCVRAAAK